MVSAGTRCVRCAPRRAGVSFGRSQGGSRPPALVRPERLDFQPPGIYPRNGLEELMKTRFAGRFAVGMTVGLVLFGWAQADPLAVDAGLDSLAASIAQSAERNGLKRVAVVEFTD